MFETVILIWNWIGIIAAVVGMVFVFILCVLAVVGLVFRIIELIRMDKLKDSYILKEKVVNTINWFEQRTLNEGRCTPEIRLYRNYLLSALDFTGGVVISGVRHHFCENLKDFENDYFKHFQEKERMEKKNE